jgi:Rps23 Pro-64 3,4-dihydroxylase Tpa1-like proline 4-hydroxylase
MMKSLALSCYGVEVRVSDAAGAGVCRRLRDILAPEFVASSGPWSSAISYVVATDPATAGAEDPGYSVTRDGSEVFSAASEEDVFRWLLQDIDSTVAQRSDGMLFVHAGVVGWRGLAIVIPGVSHTGKSTLVTELVRRGASYYSDEFGVLDDSGRVHPYRRSPVLRGDLRRAERLRLVREDEPAEPLPIALIVAGAYQQDATWRPNVVLGAQAVLPLIDSTVLVRQEAARVLRIAAQIAPTVVTLEGPRSDAAEVAARLLDLVDDAVTSRALTADKAGSGDLTNELSRIAQQRLRSQPGRPVPPDRQLAAARYVRMTDFLSPEEHQRLLDHTLACQADFHESGIVGRQGESTLNFAVRKSRTLSGGRLQEVWEMFDQRLHGIVAAVRKEMGMPWFRLGEIERQLTAHGGGGFFAPHVDTGHPIAASRRISCVYYFHVSPRRFTGGELRLYDTWITPSGSTAAGTYTTLTPLDNSVVFFPSDAFHEVLPVRCETDAFGDSRFTVTVWFREEQQPVQADGAAATA